MHGIYAYHYRCELLALVLTYIIKVLLRRNFDVMFITKNHLYQLINEDCHLKFD